jgi:hypothetical protein
MIPRSGVRAGLLTLQFVLAAIVGEGQPIATEVPPARPSASRPFLHRVARPYPVAVPAGVQAALAAPATIAERGAERWRIEKLALVRLAPEPARIGTIEGLPLGDLRAVALATDGAIWAGGPGGVLRFTGADHPWERWHVFAG